MLSFLSYSVNSLIGSFVISSFDSPLLIISPVNGFFSVGVVIVFSPFCPSLVTFSVPGAKSGLNLRSSEWNLFFFYNRVSFYRSIFCYAIDRRSNYVSCFWILNSWFTWNFLFSCSNFGIKFVSMTWRYCFRSVFC